MGSYSLAGATLAIGLAFASPAIADNLVEVQKLLSNRECQGCQLQAAGLMHADLVGVNLQGANLMQANLSQADLSGANLQGANLAGAVLRGANLSGANLQGANLQGTDLYQAYLYGANLTGVDLRSAFIREAVGLPDAALTSADFYRWGIEAGQQENYPLAVEYFSQTIQREPDFAAAYLARAVARYKMIDAEGAIADSSQAAELFALQGNPQGEATALRFVEEINAIEEAAAQEPRARGNLGNAIRGITGLLLRFLL
jgi:uncharacterized protein YjbI with pentapeptide repeats